MGELLIWLGHAHETGAGGLSIDPSLAQSYFNLAASTQNSELLTRIAERQRQTWRPQPPHSGLRFEMPVEPRSCN